MLILCGVLEHVRDLSRTLDKIALITNHSGRVFVGVPDASRYADGEDGPFQEFQHGAHQFLRPKIVVKSHGHPWLRAVALIQDVLEVNLRTTTPVVYGIFCRMSGHEAPGCPPPKDTETIRGLKDYVAKCGKEDARIQELIARIEHDREPLLIWGVGTHTLRLLAEGALSRANIVAFVDGNPKYHGRRLLDRPICPPEILRQHPEVRVLISSRAFQEEIAAEIVNGMKCVNPLVRLYSL